MVRNGDCVDERVAHWVDGEPRLGRTDGLRLRLLPNRSECAV